MSKKEDEEDEGLKQVFKEARKMKKDGPKQKNQIIELAREAVFNVLTYHGCDPEAQRMNLSNESHRKIIARSVAQVFESKLISKKLI